LSGVLDFDLLSGTVFEGWKFFSDPATYLNG